MYLPEGLENTPLFVKKFYENLWYQDFDTQMSILHREPIYFEIFCQFEFVKD